MRSIGLYATNMLRLTIVLIACTAAIWISIPSIPEPNEPVNDREMLQFGAQRGDLAMVKHALARGVDIESADEQALTPLIIASRAGRLETVRYLLAAGAKVNATAPAFGTALMTAALYGHKEVVRELLSHGADPNLRSRGGSTSLWCATIGGDSDAEMVQMLISAGADIDTPAAGGQTALMAAEESGRQDIMDVFVNAGAHRRVVPRAPLPSSSTNAPLSASTSVTSAQLSH